MEDLKTLDTKSLLLDMTTNLSRIGNFVMDNNYKKAQYFANELEEYIKELDTREYDNRLRFWIEKIKVIIRDVREQKTEGKYIADDSFTSGTVIQNRAIYLP